MVKEILTLVDARCTLANPSSLPSHLRAACSSRAARRGGQLILDTGVRSAVLRLPDFYLAEPGVSVRDSRRYSKPKTRWDFCN